MNATDAAMISAASAVRGPSVSFSSHQPSSTATTGLTKAYVPVIRGGAWRSSHSYAVYAIRLPKTIR